jgi:hypothetical protein
MNKHSGETIEQELARLRAREAVLKERARKAALYHQEWRRRNPDKIAGYNRKFEAAQRAKAAQQEG